MAEERVCWKCGALIADQPLPLARLATCAACRSDLHVCRLCAFFDAGVAKACREPVAEEVHDKERANFCGYFEPRAGAWRPQGAAVAEAARTQLEALFGVPADRQETGDHSDVHRARERLEQLFARKVGEDKP